MAVRRTIDSLTAEVASSRGVSKDNAIRIALTEALAHSKEPEPDSNIDASADIIRKIVFRQICLASIAANGYTRSQMWEEMVSPIGFALFYLTVAFALQEVGVERFSLQAMVILLVPIGVALLYYYHSRTLNPRKREEEQRCEKLKKEIQSLGVCLPDNLEFLCDGTADDSSYIESLQEDEQQEAL
jgi:uncharacterized membrane protein